MKIIFFDKVIFEGTEEECDVFKHNLLDTLGKLDDELKDTYPMKQTDTDETYFVFNTIALELRKQSIWKIEE